MRFLLLFSFAVVHCVLSPVSFSQNKFAKVENTSFRPGEMLKYRVHYGFIDAGEIVMEVKPEIQKFGSREVYHITGLGYTLGAFDWFFKIRDRYESFVDTESIFPLYSVRRVLEGSYTVNENVVYNRFENTATGERYKKEKTGDKITYPVPENIQDVLSAFYYLRTQDVTLFKQGELLPINILMDNEIHNLVVKYGGKETVKSRLGTFECIKVIPMLLEGRVFKEKEGMTIWVTDDKYYIPVRIESELMVGSLKVDLVEHKGVGILSKGK